MAEPFDEPPEFTDEQMKAALKRMGKEARREAFAAGLSITVAINGNLVLIHPDGSEEVLGPVHSETDAQSAR